MFEDIKAAGAWDLGKDREPKATLHRWLAIPWAGLRPGAQQSCWDRLEPASPRGIGPVNTPGFEWDLGATHTRGSSDVEADSLPRRGPSLESSVPAALQWSGAARAANFLYPVWKRILLPRGWWQISIYNIWSSNKNNNGWDKTMWLKNDTNTRQQKQSKSGSRKQKYTERVRKRSARAIH